MLPAIQLEPEVGDGWVRFTQTVGGRTGVPLPRPVRHAPFVQYRAPIVWSTLELTIHADGSHEARMVGASPFPRHWIYGDDGVLTGKTALADYKDWAGKAFGDRTPWGDQDEPALVSQVETALERELSRVVMAGGKRPKIIKLHAGDNLVEQGDEADDLFLLLNGVLLVEVDGEAIAELGPGAVVGERAGLEAGRRTATLRAVDQLHGGQGAGRSHRPDPAHRAGRRSQAGAAGGADQRRRAAGRLMRVDVCGVRGSTPAPGPEFAGVGGETSCVALSHDAEERPRLVLDAGTGLRRVTSLLGGEPFRGTILLGHLHWDHTHGLPFFRGGDREDASTTVLLPEQGVEPIELLDRFMGPPMFPVTFEGLRGSWTAGALEEGRHEIEGFRVLAREIPHKGGRTFGYRVADEVGSLAYLSDHGPRGALGPGPDGWGPYHEAALELCAGVDLLIHDAQHTAAELPAASATSVTPPLTTRWSSAAAPASTRCCCSTTTPTAPTPRSRRWPPAWRGREARWSSRLASRPSCTRATVPTAGRPCRDVM